MVLSQIADHQAFGGVVPEIAARAHVEALDMVIATALAEAGVGFAAIDHNAPPRLHPKSPDVLEEGMVFNVEPAAYFPNECGMRHCDMVAVTSTGSQVLTPFHQTIEELVR